MHWKANSIQISRETPIGQIQNGSHTLDYLVKGNTPSVPLMLIDFENVIHKKNKELDSPRRFNGPSSSLLGPNLMDGRCLEEVIVSGFLLATACWSC